MRLILILFVLTNFTLFANNHINENKTNNETELFDSFEKEFDNDKKKDFDPLKGYNIVMTNFNDKAYTNILFPISRKYSEYVSQNTRVSISNFFDNLLFAKRFINNILQLKFSNAFDESVRFIVNSTVGILGFYDPASEWLKLEKHNEDFGQTLGYYGVGGGFHIVLPLLGPSNLRDAISLFPDAQLDPVNYLDTQELIASKTIYIVNEASFNADKYESLKKDSLELYPLLKDFYEQHRESEIKK